MNKELLLSDRLTSPIAFYEERGKGLATRKYDVVFLPVNHLFKLNKNPLYLGVGRDMALGLTR